MAKIFPDSRRPRRLAIVIRVMTTTAISTVHFSMPGSTDTICAIADAVETATVIT
jgi:hypothetical protein